MLRSLSAHWLTLMQTVIQPLPIWLRLSASSEPLGGSPETPQVRFPKIASAKSGLLSITPLYILLCYSVMYVIDFKKDFHNHLLT